MILTRDIRLTRNLCMSEYVCKEGKDEVFVEPEHVRCVQDFIYFIEKKLKKYIVVWVTSGYRSKDYNASVGGSPTSQHLDGLASDLKFYWVNEEGKWRYIKPLEVYEAAIEFGKFSGCGLYDKFVHLDNRPKERIPSGKKMSTWDLRK